MTRTLLWCSVYQTFSRQYYIKVGWILSFLFSIYYVIQLSVLASFHSLFLFEFYPKCRSRTQDNGWMVLVRVRVCSPWYLVQAHHQAGQVEEEEHDDHGDQDLGDVRLLLVHHREPVRSDPNRELWSLLRYRLICQDLWYILKLRIVRTMKGRIPVVVIGWKNWKTNKNLQITK